MDEEIEFCAVQTASTSSVTRDFASQNVSLRERDCHLPHGGRLIICAILFAKTAISSSVLPSAIHLLRWRRLKCSRFVCTNKQNISISVGEGLAPPACHRIIFSITSLHFRGRPMVAPTGLYVVVLFVVYIFSREEQAPPLPICT